MSFEVLVIIALVCSFVSGFFGKPAVSAPFIFVSVVILALSSEASAKMVATGIITLYILGLFLQFFRKSKKS